MKTEFINGHFKTKSNFDFEDEIISSPNYKLKHVEQLKIEAETTGDSEINIKAVIPFDGRLVINRAEGKNAMPLLSVEVNKGFFITTIPVSMHDETQELDCILISKKLTQQIKVELVHSEIHQD